MRSLSEVSLSFAYLSLARFSFQSQRKAMPKNAQTIAQLCFSHMQTVMLKILQARLQQYVNRENPDVQGRFRKGRGTRDEIDNIHWIIEKAREFQKTSTSASLTMLKPLTLWITTTLWRIFQEKGIPDHLTRLLRNLYACQGATVRTGHGTTD